jgi:hypothetical protein
MDSDTRKTLIVANVAMLLMMAIHDADHIRQAINWCYTIPGWLLAVNTVVYVPNGLALFASIRRHRIAPLATTVGSLFIAVSFSTLHLWKPLIPVWGIWNQSFFKLNADQFSWSILALTVVVAVGVAIVGGWAGGRASALVASPAA